MSTKTLNKDIRLKLLIKKQNNQEIKILLRTPPVIDFLTQFYELPLNNFFFVNSDTCLNINYFVCKTKSLLYLSTILHLKHTFYPSFIFCLDYFLYKFYEQYNATLNFASLLTNLRLNICFELSKTLSIPSLSTIFLNTNWLERELIDFSGIYVIKLKDSRRLMLDYLQFRNYPTTLKVYDFTYNHYINDLYTIKWLVHF